MPRRRKPSPAARADTPAAILAAARRRYVRFGPRKTTMGEVAREAGCSRATLYAHFPGKRALYAGILESERLAFLAALETALAASSGARQKLRAFFEVTQRVYADSPVLSGALSGDGEMTLEPVARRVAARTEERVIALLRAALEEGVAEGSLRDVDTEAVAWLMYRLGREIVNRQVTGRGRFPFRRMLGAMDDVMARGLARTRAG